VDIFCGPDSISVADDKYYIAEYFLESETNLRDAAWNLAIGQSIGNPSARSEFESEELFKNHSCLILGNEKELMKDDAGIIKIAFPVANINFATDGITQVLVQTMGGQCDIKNIKTCFLCDIEFPPSMMKHLKGPKFGLKGMKAFCGVDEKTPLFGGITKPKVGLSPQRHLDLVKCLVDGGCNFIKEDEILSDPDHCRIEDRVPLVMNYLAGKKIFYCVSIHADAPYLLERVKQVYDLGGNGVHVNFHAGLGSFKAIRNLDFPMLMHYQKSGDKLLNSNYHRYLIEEKLMFKLVGLSGCDTLHAGMIGGYYKTREKETKEIIQMLNDINCVPALSCGMHPGLIDHITNILGHGNWMANVGGALFSHPGGTLAGVKAMAQAVSGNYGQEYHDAIKKWGKIK
jgi:ribulose-bisphosphate carboxylase large chain